MQRGAHPARAPPKIGKNMIFWRKIVIFHTKYPKNVRASLSSAQFFLSGPPPPNLKSLTCMELGTYYGSRSGCLYYNLIMPKLRGHSLLAILVYTAQHG